MQIFQEGNMGIVPIVPGKIPKFLVSGLNMLLY